MLPIGLKSGLAVFFCKALVFSIKWYFFVKWKTKLCKNNFKQSIYQEIHVYSTLSTIFSTEKLWKGEITVSIFVEKVEKR